MEAALAVLCRLGAPPSAIRAVYVFAGAVAEALGANLVDICVYGSLARGDYHPATSDVDLLVLTRKPLNTAAIAPIQAAHHGTGLPLDVLFVAASLMDGSPAAAGADATLKPAGASAGRIRRVGEGRPDLLIDRQDAHDCGVALLGSPAADALPAAPWDALNAALRWLFPRIVPNFKNPVLMLCRVTHALATHQLAGKVDAALWAQGAFDTAWHPLIDRALSDYTSGIAGSRPQEIHSLEAYCRRFAGL